LEKKKQKQKQKKPLSDHLNDLTTHLRQRPTEFAPQIQSVWMMAERSQNGQTSETVVAL